MQLKPTHSKNGRLSGFTLIEVVVTIGLLGISLLALHNGMLCGTVMLENARENLRANQILVEKMETIRLYTFDQINTAGFIPTTFSAYYQPATAGNTNNSGFQFQGTITISNPSTTASYSNDLKMVTVRVQWTTGSLTHSRDMQTLIARNGLQSYIY